MKFRTKTKRLVQCMACLALVSLPMSAFAQTPKAYRVTPDIKGRRNGVAQQLARLRGFGYEQGVFFIAPKHWRDSLKSSVIYLQAPAPKAPISSTGAMAGWAFKQASKSQRVLSMPDLRSLTVEVATARLKSLGLARTENASSDRRESGLVTDHYPRPNQNIYVGTSVFFRTSKDE